ncbi:acetate--CoA ligase family protein [Corynebacterium callunae]|uniref:acetate--CoA ligase family protein n=1 Tax=Corynebacterium callunae TaxID=1721 RepID=UPI0020004596|nr:acetate--CoA ligase family protein [Corynebacterium callunae]MCK2201615.1 CoA-binding protein [Corynebacterium callunae]
MTTSVTEKFQPLFAPRSVAIIGASKSPGKLGSVMAEAMSAYDAPVYLINPRGGEGMFTSVEEAAKDAGQPIDLAILCIPAGFTAASLADCAKGGVKAALLCAGGFAEAQGEGYQYEEEMQQAAKETGIMILGPNTSGYFVPGIGLHASFVPGVAEIPTGCIGVVSASGGVNHSTCFRLQRAGVGVSVGVGIGGGVGVTSADVVDYLAEDDNTSVIILHLETIPDGPRLAASVRRAVQKKPVIGMVIGKHDVKEFAERHTGSLATSWHATRSILEQAGAVIAEDEQEMVEMAIALEHQRIAEQRDPGIALLTGQAGTGLIMHDHLLNAEARFTELQPETIEQIESLLPPMTFQHNPVDTGRPAINFWEVMKAVVADPGVSALGVYSIVESLVHLPTAVEESGALGKLPVVLGTDSITSSTDKVIADARAKGIPMVLGPTAVARGVKALARDGHAQWAIAQPAVAASAELATQLFDAATADNTDAAAEVQLVLGAHRDPVFGPVVTCGLAGTAEAVSEPVIHLAEVSLADADRVLRTIPGAAVLRDEAGNSKVDPAELAELLATLGKHIADNESVEKITLKPVSVTAEGLKFGTAEVTNKLD